MIPRIPFRTLLVAALLLLGSLPTAAPAAGRDAAAQLKFGVDMARRGLWREALFRFEQARELEGGDSARILNNIAVAHEALGEFEAALEVYREAVRRSPSSTELKRNYSSFIEFYQSLRPPEEPAAEGEQGDASGGEAEQAAEAPNDSDG